MSYQLQDVIVYSNALSRRFGLMFSRQKTLVFTFEEEQIVPLHMMFVFYKIDVLFLNKDQVVVEMKQNFKPFTFYIPKNKAAYVIELRQGAIKDEKIIVGEKIDLTV